MNKYPNGMPAILLQVLGVSRNATPTLFLDVAELISLSAEKVKEKTGCEAGTKQTAITKFILVSQLSRK